MAIVKELGKGENILEIAGAATEDLSSSQYCLVAIKTGVSSGHFTVSLPSGQGVQTLGVLQNTPASGEQANVRVLGTTKVVANGTFNCGTLLTPAATTGKAGAASSGDYVIGVALQAAAEANHEVWCAVNGINPAQVN